MSENGTLSHERVRDFLDPILGADLHAKRIVSLADATTGALHAASLAVCAIGAGLATAKGLNPKHAGKQVDRMLSNPGIDLDASSRSGSAISWAGATPSRSPWTGPTSTPTAKPPCCSP